MDDVAARESRGEGSPDAGGARKVGFPTHLALRDLAIAIVTAAIWALYLPRAGESSAFVVALAGLAGALTAVVGFLVHEWGHLAGARYTRSRYHHPRSVASIFLFKFEDEGNDRRQFLWMANGGFLASALTIAALVAVMDLGRLGDRIALGLSALGVLATLVLELPPAIRVYRGEAIPPDLVKLPD